MKKLYSGLMIVVCVATGLYSKEISYDAMQQRALQFEKKRNIKDPRSLKDPSIGQSLFDNWIDSGMARLIFINNTPKNFFITYNQGKMPGTNERKNIEGYAQLTAYSMHFAPTDYDAFSYELKVKDVPRWAKKGDEITIKSKDLGIDQWQAIPGNMTYIIEIRCTKQAAPGQLCDPAYDWAVYKK